MRRFVLFAAFAAAPVAAQPAHGCTPGGTCVSGDCTDGTGVLVQPDNVRIEGAFAACRPEGTVVVRHPDGWTWTGPFAAGRPSGHGRYVTPAGREVTSALPASVLGLRDQAASAAPDSSGSHPGFTLADFGEGRLAPPASRPAEEVARRRLDDALGSGTTVTPLGDGTFLHRSADGHTTITNRSDASVSVSGSDIVRAAREARAGDASAPERRADGSTVYRLGGGLVRVVYADGAVSVGSDLDALDRAHRDLGPFGSPGSPFGRR